MIQNEMMDVFQNDDVEIVNPENHQKLNKQEVSNKKLLQMKQKQIAEVVQELDWNEKFEWLNYQLQKANKLFDSQDYDRAIQIYQEMSVGLDLGQDENKNRIMKEEFQYKILSNLAMCYRRKKDYEKALKLYDMVISLDPQPIRFLKRGYAFQENDNTDKAIQDLKTYYQLGGRQNSDAIRLQEIIELSKNQEKKLYQNMFKSSQQYYEQKQSQSQQQSKQQQQQYQSTQQFEEQEEEQEEVGQNITSAIYSKIKSIILQIFGCKRIFSDNSDSESEEEFSSDPRRFVQN